jgi:hypothetical protein
VRLIGKDAANVRRAIAKLKAAGVLAPEADARCLLMAYEFRGGGKTPNDPKRCSRHGVTVPLPANQRAHRLSRSSVTLHCSHWISTEATRKRAPNAQHQCPDLRKREVPIEPGPRREQCSPGRVRPGRSARPLRCQIPGHWRVAGIIAVSTRWPGRAVAERQHDNAPAGRTGRGVRTVYWRGLTPDAPECL